MASNVLDMFTRTADERNSYFNQNVVYTAGAALTIGQAVYLKQSDQKVYPAKANSFLTMPCIGFCMVTAASGDNVYIQRSGRFSGIIGTITAGQPVFVSDATAGNVTTTQLAASGDVEQCVGRAISTTDIEIQIQSTNIVNS